MLPTQAGNSLVCFRPYSERNSVWGAVSRCGLVILPRVWGKWVSVCYAQRSLGSVTIISLALKGDVFRGTKKPIGSMKRGAKGSLRQGHVIHLLQLKPGLVLQSTNSGPFCSSVMGGAPTKLIRLVWQADSFLSWCLHDSVSSLYHRPL